MKKGISLIVLVVTVIMIMIISSVVIVGYWGFGSKINAYKKLDELSIIETNVMKIGYEAEEQLNYDFVGELLTLENPMIVGEQVYPSNINIGPWYYITENQLNNINIQKITGNYIVNYVTGQVIFVDGLMIDNVMYYTFDDIAQAINFVQ